MSDKRKNPSLATAMKTLEFAAREEKDKKVRREMEATTRQWEERQAVIQKYHNLQLEKALREKRNQDEKNRKEAMETYNRVLRKEFPRR